MVEAICIRLRIESGFKKNVYTKVVTPVINISQILREITIILAGPKKPGSKTNIKNSPFFILNQAIILITKGNYLYLEIVYYIHISGYDFYL